MNSTNATLQHQLSTKCQAFVEVADRYSEEQFSAHVADKWSVAEVMQHLYLSARPVMRLMTGPHDVFLQWGRADAPSRSYAEIASAYETALSTGVKAPESVSPRPEDMQASKQDVVARFAGVYQALGDALAGWSAGELDEYRLPHPVLGKLTVREMLYFVSVHTQHHLQLLTKA